LFIAEGAGGDLIVGDGGAKRILRVSGGKLRPILDQFGDSSLDPHLLTRDRDGNVWVGTAGQGLLRLRGAGYERFTRHDGLSSDFINAFLEDREGNLWVGTVTGIDQFREPKVLHVSTRDGLSSDAIMAVCAARNGGIWVGTIGGGLNRVDGGRIGHYLMNSGLPSTTIESLYEDAGGLWVGTTGGLVHRSKDRFVEVRDPDGQHLNRVFAITEDRTGTLILADGAKGLFSLREGVVKSLSVPGSEKKSVYQLVAARSGVLWVGYYQGGITAISGDLARFYDTAQGLAQGPVQAIYEDRGGTIWVGTGGGLSRFRRGRWTTWTTKQGLPDGGVQGIVEDDRNGLWLMTGNGILSLPLATLNYSPDGSPGNLAFTLCGLTEGLRLASSSNMANPRIAKSNDGRLWVSTEDGVAVIDPGRIRHNPVPPPVVIEQLLVDGRPVDTSPVSGIEFRGRELQIAYTGLSLTVPESVRFRYKLEGLDRNWTEAGTRRYVAYVNLPPGPYAFRVLACNNEGVWNATGATLAFQIAPQFYQNKWFAALCVGVAALLVWGAYRLRVRRLVSRFQLVAQERARMTRDLHDSLLQGFAGVVYQLEAASRLYESNPEVSKRRLERAIDQADESLREARRAIMSMRLPELENATLPEALNAIGHRTTEGSSIAFHLAVKGQVRQLPYEVQASLYLVGREAIANSVNHACPKRIAAQLVYSTKSVCLSVQDDGIGFDLEAAMAKKDHWGVIGMHERAKHIGAILTVDTASGQGTRIELAAPLKT
jgi:signal transduction histidine kinase/ligand-binding sensor domain-containing protein